MALAYWSGFCCAQLKIRAIAGEHVGQRGPAHRVVERLVGCHVVVVDLVDRRNALGDDPGAVLTAIADGGFQIDQASTLPELNAEAPAAGLR